MNIQTITKIISAVLSLLGVVFLLRILRASDEGIKMAASVGDYSLVSPLVSLALFIIAVTVLVTLIFSIRNLATSPQKLKKALIFIGFFALVVLIAYVTSTGVETELKDDKILSASASRWVGAGIRTFYILASIAFLLMILSGGKKFLNK